MELLTRNTYYETEPSLVERMKDTFGALHCSKITTGDPLVLDYFPVSKRLSYTFIDRANFGDVTTLFNEYFLKINDDYFYITEVLGS